MPNIQGEVPLKRIALLRIAPKILLCVCVCARFTKSTQVDVLEKFVWLGNGPRQYE